MLHRVVLNHIPQLLDALARSCAFLRRANMLGIEALIMKAQLRWAGHVVRMDDTRPPKMVLFFELATVARNKERPVKRFKETGWRHPLVCAAAFPLLDGKPSPPPGRPQRLAWRMAVQNGVQGFEKKGLHDLDQKRWAYKEGDLTQVLPLHTRSVVACMRRTLDTFSLLLTSLSLTVDLHNDLECYLWTGKTKINK